MKNSILSILVITHNQRDLLKRCLQSVLAQELHVPFEVIVSDDRSMDGTEEWITAYQQEIINKQKNGELPNLVELRYVHCNSDECCPSMTSERASYNRLNGLKFARGKYIIHVDGDDFFTSTDIFYTLINTLEMHPECTIVHQNYRIKDEEQVVEDAPMAYPMHLFEDDVISSDEFIQRFDYIHNSACCMRRSPIEWTNMLRRNYDDYDITFVYLKQGKVALVNRADFIYCKYKKQTASKFASIDQMVCWTTEIPLMLEFPEYTGSFLKRGKKSLKRLINLALKEPQLQPDTINHLKQRKDAFLIRVFLQHQSPCMRLRLRLAKIWIIIMNRLSLSSSWSYRLMYRLSVQWSIPTCVRF